MKFSAKQTLSQVLLIACAALALTACGEKSKTESMPTPVTPTAGSDTKQVYRVALEDNAEPFVIRDAKGQPNGFDVDVLNAIAESQNIKFKYEIKMWNGILEGLNAGKHDIVAGTVITPERQNAYDFSDMYIDTQWALILKDQSHDNKPPFKTFDEAVKNSKTLAVVYGSSGHPAMEKIAEENSAQLVEAKSVYSGIADVAKGKVDAFYENSRVQQYYANKLAADPQTKVYTVTNPNSGVGQFGFAMKKGRNDDLKDKINTGLQQLKTNGKYEQIKEKWFGKNA